jgi:hypothetical protein
MQAQLRASIAVGGELVNLDEREGWAPQGNLSTTVLIDVWGTGANDVYVLGRTSDAFLSPLIFHSSAVAMDAARRAREHFSDRELRIGGAAVFDLRRVSRPALL